MPDELHQYLEKTWLLLEEHTADPNIRTLKKICQQRKDNLHIIHLALQKIRALKEIPQSSEDCVKLVFDILLREAIAQNKLISDEKKQMIFDSMLKNLNANKPILEQHYQSGFFSFKLFSLLKLSLSLAAGAAALWFTGPYCALAARYLFSVGYIALHGEPNIFVQYSYFLPAQEWVGNLAFNYGPKILSVPTGVMSAQAVEVAAKALNHSEKLLVYAYQKTKQSEPFNCFVDKINDISAKSAPLIACL